MTSHLSSRLQRLERHHGGPPNTLRLFGVVEGRKVLLLDAETTNGGRTCRIIHCRQSSEER